VAVVAEDGWDVLLLLLLSLDVDVDEDVDVGVVMGVVTRVGVVMSVRVDK
jgi:hypothetical protein